MRKIDKGEAPPELTRWIRRNPHKCYDDLDKTPEGVATRRAIRDATITEQHGLCAYCCNKIYSDDGNCCNKIYSDDGNCHNEHVQPQDKAPNRTVDFTNIVASCNAKKQCGFAHKNQKLPLTPLDPACETDLKFYPTGHVEGKNTDAKETIRVLNLNKPDLEKRRKMGVDALIFEKYGRPEELQLADDGLLSLMLEELLELDNENNLQPFAPVFANIIRHWLAQRYTHQDGKTGESQENAVSFWGAKVNRGKD